jgi:hypothetical protein
VEKEEPADEAHQMIRGLNKNLNPNMYSVINKASFDRVNEYLGPHREIETTLGESEWEALKRLQRAKDLEVMDEQRVILARRHTPSNVYVTTPPRSPVEAMLMNDVTEQTTQAKAQAKADADAEKKAKRSGKPVKRKKTADNNEPQARKDPPGPDKDKVKRLV